MSNFVDMVLIFLITFFFHSANSMMQDPEMDMFSDKAWSIEEMMQMDGGYGEEKLSTVLVSGTVLCEVHSHGQLRAWPISGASVAVKCLTRGKAKRGHWAQSITNQSGDFVIDLPSHLHAIPHLHKNCVVKVLKIPNGSKCKPARVKKQKVLQLSLALNGKRTYTAGRIRFQSFASISSQAYVKKVSKEKRTA